MGSTGLLAQLTPEVWAFFGVVGAAIAAIVGSVVTSFLADRRAKPFREGEQTSQQRKDTLAEMKESLAAMLAIVAPLRTEVDQLNEDLATARTELHECKERDRQKSAEIRVLNARVAELERTIREQ